MTRKYVISDHEQFRKRRKDAHPARVMTALRRLLADGRVKPADVLAAVVDHERERAA